MKIIAVTEDRGGMFFNGRRESRDRTLNEDIIRLTGSGRLWVAPISADMFPNAIVDEHFLDMAGNDDFCFVEDRSLQLYEKFVSDVYLYHWNRRYPADIYFDLPLERYHVVAVKEFAGYSHDKITMEHYRKMGEED